MADLPDTLQRAFTPVQDAVQYLDSYSAPSFLWLHGVTLTYIELTDEKDTLLVEHEGEWVDGQAVQMEDMHTQLSGDVYWLNASHAIFVHDGTIYGGSTNIHFGPQYLYAMLQNTQDVRQQAQHTREGATCDIPGCGCRNQAPRAQVWLHDTLNIDHVPYMPRNELKAPGKHDIPVKQKGSSKQAEAQRAACQLNFLQYMNQPAMNEHDLNHLIKDHTNPCEIQEEDDFDLVKDNRKAYEYLIHKSLDSKPLPWAYARQESKGQNLSPELIKLLWDVWQHDAALLKDKKRMAKGLPYVQALVENLVSTVIQAHEGDAIEIPSNDLAGDVKKMKCSERLYMIIQALKTMELTRSDFLNQERTAELIAAPHIVLCRKNNNFWCNSPGSFIKDWSRRGLGEFTEHKALVVSHRELKMRKIGAVRGAFVVPECFVKKDKPTVEGSKSKKRTAAQRQTHEPLRRSARLGSRLDNEDSGLDDFRPQVLPRTTRKRAAEDVADGDYQQYPAAKRQKTTTTTTDTQSANSAHTSSHNRLTQGRLQNAQRAQAYTTQYTGTQYADAYGHNTQSAATYLPGAFQYDTQATVHYPGANPHAVSQVSGADQYATHTSTTPTATSYGGTNSQFQAPYGNTFQPVNIQRQRTHGVQRLNNQHHDSQGRGPQSTNTMLPGAHRQARQPTNYQIPNGGGHHLTNQTSRNFDPSTGHRMASSIPPRQQGNGADRAAWHAALGSTTPSTNAVDGTINTTASMYSLDRQGAFTDQGEYLPPSDDAHNPHWCLLGYNTEAQPGSTDQHSASTQNPHMSSAPLFESQANSGAIAATVNLDDSTGQHQLPASLIHGDQATSDTSPAATGSEQEAGNVQDNDDVQSQADDFDDFITETVEPGEDGEGVIDSTV